MQDKIEKYIVKFTECCGHLYPTEYFRKIYRSEESDEFSIEEIPDEMKSENFVDQSKIWEKYKDKICEIEIKVVSQS